MLTISKNSINLLYVTVTEKTTLNPVYYLMSLYSNDDHTTKVVRFSGDTSTNPNRWNIFQLKEVAEVDEDLEIGWINLMQASTYDYIIYQTSNMTGTSISGAGPVERGLLKVNSTGSTSSTFTNYNSIITFE